MSWNQQSWNKNSTSEGSFLPVDVRDERVGAFLSKVYGWMFVGLFITAVTAYGVASSPTLIEAVIVNRLVFWGLIIAQLGLVFYLSARVEHMAPATAAGLFMLYSALVGVTTSVILLAFTGASIASTFIITAGMFGGMAFFGTVTKRSLAGWGQFLFMGLIGLIVAIDRRLVLAKRRHAIRYLGDRRFDFYRTNSLGCATAKADGSFAA